MFFVMVGSKYVALSRSSAVSIRLLGTWSRRLPQIAAVNQLVTTNVPISQALKSSFVEGLLGRSVDATIQTDSHISLVRRLVYCLTIITTTETSLEQVIDYACLVVFVINHYS